EVKELGEVGIVKKGKLITEKKADSNGSIKVVSAGISFSYFHSKPNFKKYTITISASGANAGYVNFWKEPIFANDCTTVRGKSDSETFVFLEFLRMRQKYLFDQARGSAQPHVYPKDISNLKIEFPYNNLIDKYGEIIFPVYE